MRKSCNRTNGLSKRWMMKTQKLSLSRITRMKTDIKARETLLLREHGEGNWDFFERKFLIINLNWKMLQPCSRLVSMYPTHSHFKHKLTHTFLQSSIIDESCESLWRCSLYKYNSTTDNTPQMCLDVNYFTAQTAHSATFFWGRYRGWHIISSRSKRCCRAATADMEKFDQKI